MIEFVFVHVCVAVQRKSRGNCGVTGMSVCTCKSMFTFMCMCGVEGGGDVGVVVYMHLYKIAQTLTVFDISLLLT